MFITMDESNEVDLSLRGIVDGYMKVNGLPRLCADLVCVASDVYGGHALSSSWSLGH